MCPVKTSATPISLELIPEFAKLVEPIYKNIGITEEFYKQLMDEMAKIRAEQK